MDLIRVRNFNNNTAVLIQNIEVTRANGRGIYISENTSNEPIQCISLFIFIGCFAYCLKRKNNLLVAKYQPSMEPFFQFSMIPIT